MANKNVFEETNHIVTVAEGKRIFETLAKSTFNSRPVVNQQIVTKQKLAQTTNKCTFPTSNIGPVAGTKEISPPKPKRTFAEDHYFDPDTLKPVTIATVKKKVSFDDHQEIAKPVVQPKRWSVKEISRTFTNVESPQSDREKPKYFQLSHDYEQIFSGKFKSKIPPHYFGSVQNLAMIKEYENYNIDDQYNIGYEEINDDDLDERLHYASTEIIHTDQDEKLDLKLMKSNNNLQLKKINVPEDPLHKRMVGMSKSDDKKSKFQDSWFNEDYDLSDNEPDYENYVLRAKQIRRESLMHYDYQEQTFLKRKDPKLFEFAALIELKANDQTDIKYKKQLLPVVTSAYPERISDPMDLTLNTLRCLCYPDINTTDFSLYNNENDEQFIITLTDCCGDRKFAYCVKFFGPRRRILMPSVLCIVSPVQAIEFYQSFVREAVIRAKVNVDSLIMFLRRYYAQPLPAPNDYMIVKSIKYNLNVVLFNKKASSSVNYLHMVLERFGVDDMIILFANLLTEKRILLVGDNVSVLSKVVQGASNMLAPFLWPHPSIPTVPDSLLEFVDSPSPYVMGVLRPCLPEITHVFKKDYDFIFIYDIDHGILKDGKKDSRDDERLDEKYYRFLRMYLIKNLKHRLTDIFQSPRKMKGEDFDSKIADVYLSFFANILMKYKEFIVVEQDGTKKFQKENFIKSASTKYVRKFVKYFVETGMFQIWINEILEERCLKNNATNVQLDRAISKLKLDNGNRNLLNRFVKRTVSNN